MGGGGSRSNYLPPTMSKSLSAFAAGRIKGAITSLSRVPFSQSPLSDARGATLIFVLPTEGPFALDPTTGDLVTAVPLDREQHDYYSITGERPLMIHDRAVLFLPRVTHFTNTNTLNSSCLFCGRDAFNAQSTKVNQMLVER